MHVPSWTGGVQPSEAGDDARLTSAGGVHVSSGFVRRTISQHTRRMTEQVEEASRSRASWNLVCRHVLVLHRTGQG